MLPLILGSVSKPRISNLSWEEQDARLCEDRNRGQKCAYFPRSLEAVRHRSRERCSFQGLNSSTAVALPVRLAAQAEPDGTEFPVDRH